MQVIALSNNKGGVAKTTTALAIGAGFSREGYRVLYIDLDFQQGNLTDAVGAKTEGVYTALDVLTQKCKATQALQRTAGSELIIGSPASIDSDKTVKLIPDWNIGLLKEALKDLTDKFDCVVIDTSPYYNVIVENAIVACTMAIIPMSPAQFSIKGLYKFLEKMFEIKKRYNPAFVEGIVITCYKQVNLHRDIAEAIKYTAARFNLKLFSTKIREYIAVGESQMKGQSIFDYAPATNIYNDYDAFIKEMLGKE